MRLNRSLTLIMMAMLAALLTFSGCDTKPAAEEVTVERACIEMLQKVPVYSESFTFWNVKTLRNDADLGELYKVWQERKVKSLEERFEIPSSGIEYLAEAELLTIIKGEFNLEAVRKRISSDYYRDTNYQDMEVWKSEPSHDPSSATGGWVLAEGLLIRGANNSNVDDYIHVARGEELSMYDKNAAEVLERLTEGMIIDIRRGSPPEGLIVEGRSYSKENKGTYRWNEVYKFRNSEDIDKAKEDYFKKIEDDFKKAEEEFARRGETAPYRSFTLKQDGQFVEWSVLIEEKYLIYSLFYG